jgi:hypothetical protein
VAASSTEQTCETHKSRRDRTAINADLQCRKHDRISQVGAWLQKVASGYDQYHAVLGGIDQLGIFRNRVNRLWVQS